MINQEKVTTTELSTVIYKIDWNYILDNMLDKKLWEMKWKIFDYDGLKITLSIREISIKKKTVVFRLEPSPYVMRWESYNLTIPFSLDHRKLEVFKKSLYSSIRRIIGNNEYHHIYEHPSYKQAQDIYREQRSSWNQVGVDFLNSLEIENEDVRDAYISVHDNNFNSSVVSNTMDQLEYTLSTSLYLMNAHLNGTQDQYESFLKFTHKTTEEVELEIKEALDAIDIQDMANEAKESLGETK